MPPAGQMARAGLRFVASVLIVSGILLLVDAALTVTWQEPVSAFLAQRQQDSLGRELDRGAELEAGDLRATASIKDTRKRLAKLGQLARRRARAGHPIGRIKLPTLGRRYVVVEGTDETSLRKGPGHYPHTSFPGQGGTVAIAGHRTTYLAPFRTIDKLHRGDRIELEMPYGRFVYAVERTQVVPPTALWITRRVPGAERLVLSACHPLYSASHRIIAFARLKFSVPAWARSEHPLRR